jgi:hypothetical protein
MAIFQNEVVPIFTHSTSNYICSQYEQNPEIVPLTSQPIYIMRQPQPQQNYIVPIVAVVGVVSLFGFLAFLAFLKR